jgi:uncharacterized cupin superfamily protein
VARIDELPQIWNGVGKLVRSGLGISAFGVQILDLPPNYTTGSHDESESGQEELYVALRGSGAIVLDDVPDGQLPLDSDHVARVGPGMARALRSGPDGLRVLCVGAAPGRAYQAPDWTETAG